MNEILVSIACLQIVAVLCAAGIFSHHYRDNWPQFVGLVLVLLWSFGRSIDLGVRWWNWIGGELVPTPQVSTQQLLGHIGLALFAIGTAWKVWTHRHRPDNPNGTPSGHHQPTPRPQ